MNETITVMIGGKPHALPLVVTFAQLERVWPSIKVLAADGNDYLARVSAGIAFVAALTLDSTDRLMVPEVKAVLRVNVRDGTDERAPLLAAIDRIISESGLVAAGEDQPKAPAPPPATT